MRLVDTLRSFSMEVEYCSRFHSDDTKTIHSRYCWDELCADIRDTMPESFVTFRRGEAELAHGGMVIAKNNLIKIVIQEMDDCKAQLSAVVAFDCLYPQLASTHLDNYFGSLYKSLNEMKYSVAALPDERFVA